MANYISSCRTNYFKIKKNKEGAFQDFCDSIGVTVHTKTVGRTTYYMFMNEEGGIPSEHIYCGDEEFGEGPTIEWGQELAPLLKKGEVAHIVEVGQEKMRYLVGSAIWICSDGHVAYNDIDERPPKIAQFIKEHGSKVTENCY